MGSWWCVPCAHVLNTKEIVLKMNNGTGRGDVNLQELQQAFNRAAICFQQGNMMEADRICRRILKLAPGLPDVLHFRGLIACRSGEPKRGIKLLREAVKAAPSNADFLVNLGNACKEAGRSDEAIRHFQAALKIRSDIPELHNGLGVLYLEKENLKAAEKEFRLALRLRQDFAQAHFNLGRVFLAQEQKGGAIAHFKEAVRNKTDYAEAYIALAGIYKHWGIAEKALPLYEEALKYQPDNVHLMSAYGAVLQDVGRTQEALDVSRRAYDLAPIDDITTTISLGERLLLAGKHQEAREYFLESLEQNPKVVGVYNSIAASRKFQEGDPEIADMEQALGQSGLNDEALASLHFALGKVYNDCKRYDDAFGHYLQGNELRRNNIEYSHEQTESYFSELIDFFDERIFSKRPFSGEESDLPIFILGMPRSGTTLTEQIVSSHPSVFGAGELGDIGRIVNHLNSLAGKNRTYPSSLLDLDADVLQAVTQRFLMNIEAFDPDAQHITDKMPHNFIHIGLIAYLLPNARIIHCRRNPLDNCLSIFFQNFVGEHAYKWDLRELGRYYLLYERLMDHWKQVVPNPVYELQYEEMVADQEGVSRRLIEFCGLEWDDACLEFHKADRSVQTASQWQVRQPVYKSSTERWRRYEKHIGPLIEALRLVGR